MGTSLQWDKTTLRHHREKQEGLRAGLWHRTSPVAGGSSSSCGPAIPYS